MPNKMETKRNEFAAVVKQKPDLRVVKTRKVLRATLIKLLEKDAIDDITVQEICRQANVNRMTFYKHFEDKYALLNDCFNEFSNVINTNMTTRYSSVTSPEEYCYCLLSELSDFCMENKKFVKTVLSDGNTACANMISEGLQNMFTSLLARMYEERGETKEKAVIGCLASFITGGIESVAVYWGNHPEEITRQKVLDSFTPIVKAVFNPVNTDLPVFPIPEDPVPEEKQKRPYHKRGRKPRIKNDNN